MVVRRPIVLSGNFAQEGDDIDSAAGVVGSITYGSGFFNQTSSLAVDSEVDVYLTPQASGLILVAEGGRQKLADDGFTLVEAQEALLSGIAAQEGVAPAYASGVAAQRIAVEALASGNSALLAATSGIQLSNAALGVSTIAIASGNEASARLNLLGGFINAVYQNCETALASGVAADTDANQALASGNAALSMLINNPSLSQGELIALIIGLS